MTNPSSEAPAPRTARSPRIERFFSRVGILATVLGAAVGILALESWLFDPLPEETVAFDEEIGFSVGLSLVSRCDEPLTRSRGFTESERHDVQYAFSPTAGYVPVPDQPRHGIDSLGFRGPELDAPKRRRRIVFLGGSTAWGLEAKNEETYAAVLARRHPQFEFVNAGVVGYLSGQELAHFVHRVMQTEPDLVVSITGWNDAQAAFAPPARLACRNDFGVNDAAYQAESEILRLRALEDDLSQQYRLLLISHGRRSRLLNFYSRMLPRRGASATDAPRFDPENAEQERWRTRAVEAFAENMGKLDSIVRGRGGRFVVYFQPEAGQMTTVEPAAEFPAFYREFERMARERTASRGVAFASGSDAFRRHPDGGPELFVDAVHLTPGGNVVLADTLEPLLSERSEGEETP